MTDVKRCPTPNKDGSQCAVPGDLLIEAEDGLHYCWNHLPGEDAAEARELARSKGGRRSIRKAPRYLERDELSLLETPEHAMHWARTIALGAATGRLTAAACNAALKAVDAFLRGLDAVDIEKRLAKLEQRAAEREQEREQAATRKHHATPEYLTRQTKEKL